MKAISQFFAVLLFTTLCSSTAFSTQTNHQPPNMDNIEVFSDGVMHAQFLSHPLASAVVSVVRGDEILFSKGYGHQNIEKNITVDPEKTLFRIGSISKMFTWTAVMQLAEQGKIDLDADINTYLKTFQIPPTFDQPITMRHLMAHTAGFEDSSLNVLIMDDPERIAPLSATLKRYMQPRAYPPGQYIAYSNYGAALAGLIVENISGIAFKDYINEHIFSPLEMDYATFVEPIPDALSKHQAIAYAKENGRFKRKPFAILANYAPAGSASSSAVSMAKFMLAHLNNGQYKDQHLLKETTAKQMQSRLFTHDERLPGMAYGFYQQEIGGFDLIGHGGDTLYFHSNMMLDHTNNIGIFVSYVTDLTGVQASSEFIKAFYDTYFPKLNARSIEPPEDFLSRAVNYAGTYTGSRASLSTIEKLAAMITSLEVLPTPNNTLLLNSGLDIREIVEIGENLFVDPVDGLKVSFITGKDGSVDGLVTSDAPYMYAIKSPAYYSKGFNFALLGLSTLVCLSVIIGHVYRNREYKAMPLIEKRAIRASLITVCLIILSLVIIGIVVGIYSNSLIYIAVPTALKFALAVPAVVILAALGHLFFTIQVWRNGMWSRSRRLHHTLVSAAALYFAWFFYFWNILGSNYIG